MTTLTQKQGEAVSGVVRMIKDGAPCTILDGYAGTGKSTILPNIIDDLGFDPSRVAFVAPTGKAAKVMRNKLRTTYSGINTSTIHSAIYRAKPAPVGQLENDLYDHQNQLQKYLQTMARADVDRDHVKKLQKAVQRLEMELDSLYRDEKINFQLNVESLIKEADLIVMDERSMVNERMAEDLSFFGVPILAIGDPGQLPPVEGNMGFGLKADFFLTEIHRQAADNPIIRIATMARNGDEIPLGKHGDTVEVHRRGKYDIEFPEDGERPQILVGMNKTRWKLTQRIRTMFGIIENEKHLLGPQPTEPLICCKNNREFPTLVNGAECTAVSEGELVRGQTTMRMSFEDEDGIVYQDKTVFQGLFEEHYSKEAGKFSADSRSAYRAKGKSINMDWAWAITVHKSQGSQWKDVVLIDESGCFRKDANKHLYTGITRASETLKILVD